MNIGQRVTETGGRTSGFDYLRLVLSILVLLFHSVDACYGIPAVDALFASPLRPIARALLPMFFALSGFLVAGSLARSRTIRSFLWMRVIRIYPALTVEVLLSALIIGPLLTTVPLSEYFSSNIFFRYILNITGHISFDLPGVFLANPHPRTVNAQLWTVPFELYCYIALAVLAVVGLKRRPWIGLCSIVLVCVALLSYKNANGNLALTPVGPVSGYLLVASFLAGVSIYFFKEFVPFNGLFAIAAALGSVMLLAVVPGGDFMVPLPIAYITVYLGLCDPPRLKLIQGADYSYGIYLYGYVVQQALVATNIIPRLWYWNFCLSLLAVSMFAAFSWYVIEKPALKLKNWTAFRPISK